jgi:hypothetical protein
MKPISSVGEAQRIIRSFQGRPEDFLLPIAETLLDPVGINMAMITDGILAREWEPDGYIQQKGYRIYKYKKAGS